MSTNDQLPVLEIDKLEPTRDYLREAAMVLSSLQRAFLPKNSHDWHYGLEVSLRGITTQPFLAASEETRASVDLVRHNVRLNGSKWALYEYAAPEILNNLRAWLSARGVEAKLEEPKFVSGTVQFDTEQADAYAAALWWMEAQFRDIKAGLKAGITSPILLYPHHFDLALTWFPFDDERQLSLGFSTGDETIKQPYIYLTAYPEPVSFTSIPLPDDAHWQTAGFSGAILPYAKLQASAQPEELLQKFVTKIVTKGCQLFS